MTIELGFDDRLECHGYVIKRKPDFPCGGRQRVGYVVTDGGIINVMPGATWFATTADARKGIAALIVAKRIAPRPNGDGCDSNVFWALMQLVHHEVTSTPEPEPVSLRNLLDAVAPIVEKGRHTSPAPDPNREFVEKVADIALTEEHAAPEFVSTRDRADLLGMLIREARTLAKK